MDAAPTRRMYPGYTLAELEKAVAEGRADSAGTMVMEIAARKAGASQHFKTPQILGGKPTTRIGRM